MRNGLWMRDRVLLSNWNLLRNRLRLPNRSLLSNGPLLSDGLRLPDRRKLSDRYRLHYRLWMCNQQRLSYRTSVSDFQHLSDAYLPDNRKRAWLCLFHRSTCSENWQPVSDEQPGVGSGRILN